MQATITHDSRQNGSSSSASGQSSRRTRRRAARAAAHPLLERLANAAEDSPVTIDDRFDVLERIGRGGLGVVYRAFDHERGRDVALKTLPALDPGALVVLKREFRSAARLGHRNLVQLYELFVSGETAYFTMELVDGIAFDKALGEPLNDGSIALERLRPATAQLVAGVRELHANGLLHLDLKPSNVLVTRAGRVVILDFGLVQQLRQSGAAPTAGRIAGTPGYMSPQQAASETLTEAADWYAVGSILYVTLAGRLPFEGPSLGVLAHKCTVDAPPLAETATWPVPGAWSDAVDGLLAREVADRWDGLALLNAVGIDLDPAPKTPRQHSDNVLIGRDRSLEELSLARHALVRGHTVWCHVRGPSGMGKSALVHHFLDDCRRAAGTLVLDGRCYERETSPFKAVDPLIDALIAGVDEQRLQLADDVELLGDPEVLALLRMFPALWTLPALAERGDTVVRTARENMATTTPQQQRRLAFGALKLLLRAVGRHRRLIVHIDDLQWGDQDSMHLLGHLLTAPAPPLLLVLSYRGDDVGARALVDELRQHAGLLGPELIERTLDVGPLAPDDAARLVERELRGAASMDPATVARITEEGQGVPFFLVELAREVVARERRSATLLLPRSLDELLVDRYRLLDAPLQRLLASICVAGKPLPRRLVMQAASFEGDGYAALGELSRGRLVRTSGAGDDQLVDCYHARVRDAVWNALSPEDKVRSHAGWAAALKGNNSEPELLARHLHGMGRTLQAVDPLVQAARAASDNLAVDRAAALLGRAVEWAEEGSMRLAEQVPELRQRHAEALAEAGRAADAGRAFVRCAAETTEPTRRRELERRAATHFLRAGLLAEGKQLADKLLRGVGLRFPHSPRAGLVSALKSFAVLKLKGTKLRPAPAPSPATDEARFRMTMCESFGAALTPIDPLPAAALMLRGLRLAIKLGDAVSASHGLSYYGLMLVYSGRTERGMAQLRRAQTMATELGDTGARAFAQTGLGVAEVNRGNFALAAQAMTDTAALIERDVPSAYWVWGINVSTTAYVQFWTGEFGVAREGVDRYYQRALDVGDVHGQRAYPSVRAICEVVQGDPEQALALCDSPQSDVGDGEAFHFEDFVTVHARCWAHLRAGQPRRAYAVVDGAWQAMRKAGLLDLTMMKFFAHQLRANAALHAAMAMDRKPREPIVADARRSIRALRKLKQRHAAASAALLEASLATLDGSRETTLDLLREAIGELEATDVGSLTLSARRALGALLGGDEGERIVASAEDAMRASGIREPAEFARMMVPLGW